MGETAYLPISVQNVVLVVPQDEENKKWLIQRPLDAAGTDGIAYRGSKNLNDMPDYLPCALWGQIIEAVDCGDGWVITQVKPGKRRERVRDDREKVGKGQIKCFFEHPCWPYTVAEGQEVICYQCKEPIVPGETSLHCTSEMCTLEICKKCRPTYKPID